MRRAPLILFPLSIGCSGDHSLWPEYEVHRSQSDVVIQADPNTAIHDIVSAGDVDGDGLGDVLVRIETQWGDPVRADLYLGSRLTEGGVFTASEAQASFAGYVQGAGPAGDLDDDGLDDILVGDALGYGVFSGASLAMPGFRDVLDATYTISGHLDEAQLLSVLGAGDVDGDGRHDLLIFDETPKKSRIWLLNTLELPDPGDDIRAGDTLASQISRDSEVDVSLRDVGDLTGDGLPNAVLLTGVAEYGVLSKTELTWVDHDWNAISSVIAIGDVDGDGQTELGLNTAEGTLIELGPDAWVSPAPVLGQLESGTGDLDCDGAGELLFSTEDHVSLVPGSDREFSTPMHAFVDHPSSVATSLPDLSGDRAAEIALYQPGSTEITIYFTPTEAPCASR